MLSSCSYIFCLISSCKDTNYFRAIKLYPDPADVRAVPLGVPDPADVRLRAAGLDLQPDPADVRLRAVGLDLQSSPIEYKDLRNSAL